MGTKNDIRTVVERLFTKAAGGPVNTNAKVSKNHLSVIKQLEDTYDVKFTKPEELTIEQIVDICYNTGRTRALLKIKKLINEYNIEVIEVFPDKSQSIH